MIARAILVCAVLVSASAFAADAPKTITRPADQQQQQAQPQVVLASEEVPTDSSQTPAAAAPKRPRVARITTCRCGGPESGEHAQGDQ